MKSNKLSQAEKILISASELSKSKKIFSAEDLTVKSWELYQDDFSLRGYQQFPNSNQIYTFLMNKNGPMYKNGWIRKVGEKINEPFEKPLHEMYKNTICLAPVNTLSYHISRGVPSVNEDWITLWNEYFKKI